MVAPGVKREAFDRLCAGFPGVSHVVQWGGASVWKVGGKVFAIHSNWGEDGGIVLKPTEMGREIWRGAAGVAPAPYLGRAGWIIIAAGAMSDEELSDMIAASHAQAAAKLTRAKRAELRL